jgi:hypothetical protein
VNNCVYDCRNPNKSIDQIQNLQLVTVAENLTRDNMSLILPEGSNDLECVPSSIEPFPTPDHGCIPPS